MTASRSGPSQVLVLRGQAGVGKTALLRYVLGKASGQQIAQASGIQSEMELAFAGLQQFCAPLTKYSGRYPTRSVKHSPSRSGPVAAPA